MATQITKHFSLDELSCSSVADEHGINNEGYVYSYGCGYRENLFYTCCMLEIIRIHLGAPIKISSGIRCPELNELVGGSPNSNHLRGLAVDVNQGSRSLNKKFYLVAHNLKNILPINELINENDYSWIHVSFKNLK